jgi:hypothetical protein
MNYIPGIIHEKYQQFHYYEMLNNFTISILDDARYKDLQSAQDWDDLTYTLDLEKGDIICVRFFKNNQTLSAYTYLDFYIADDERFDVNQETIISRDLIDINSNLFDNVTLQYERDMKINDILND